MNLELGSSSVYPSQLPPVAARPSTGRGRLRACTPPHGWLRPAAAVWAPVSDSQEPGQCSVLTRGLATGLSPLCGFTRGAAPVLGLAVNPATGGGVSPGDTSPPAGSLAQVAGRRRAGRPSHRHRHRAPSQRAGHAGRPRWVLDGRGTSGAGPRSSARAPPTQQNKRTCPPGGALFHGSPSHQAAAMRWAWEADGRLGAGALRLRTSPRLGRLYAQINQRRTKEGASGNSSQDDGTSPCVSPSRNSSVCFQCVVVSPTQLQGAPATLQVSCTGVGTGSGDGRCSQPLGLRDVGDPAGGCHWAIGEGGSRAVLGDTCAR